MDYLTTITDQELSRRLTDVRITLESILPYTDRATKELQRRLRDELSRRMASKKSPLEFPKTLA